MVSPRGGSSIAVMPPRPACGAWRRLRQRGGEARLWGTGPAGRVWTTPVLLFALHEAARSCSKANQRDRPRGTFKFSLTGNTSQAQTRLGAAGGGSSARGEGIIYGRAEHHGVFTEGSEPRDLQSRNMCSGLFPFRVTGKGPRRPAVSPSLVSNVSHPERHCCSQRISGIMTSRNNREEKGVFRLPDARSHDP